MTEVAPAPEATVETEKKKDKAKAPTIERATSDLFESKKPHSEDSTVKINGRKVLVTWRAIGRRKYDMLLSACPASTKQRAEGLTYDQTSFAPKLLSEVMIEPAMSEAQWRNIWNDENWNRAELGDLFEKAVDVCSVGVSLGPTEPV